MTVNNLAVLERDEGNLGQSAALFQRALDSFVRAVGARHPNAVLARSNRRAIEHEMAAKASGKASPKRPARRLKKAGRNRR